MTQIANLNQILDLIALACREVKGSEPQNRRMEAAAIFEAQERRIQLGFDLFLVAMHDELAVQAGPPAERFAERIVRMIEIK